MPDDISKLAKNSTEIEEIPVQINFDIIRLFSEGLYKSPHKAIEELVSNGYDANASKVHVLLPKQPENNTKASAPLWVIDNGRGMDEEGFRQLWRIADSNKNNLAENERPPIGQFGIGKLAAYVLAWKLTHLSYVKGKLLLAVMNFREVTGRQSESADPVQVSLREVTQKEAKKYLAEIKRRDPGAWELMFGKDAQSDSWTAAALSDFRDLYKDLKTGTLKWVLRTGLPLVSNNFEIAVDGEFLTSAKKDRDTIDTINIDENLSGIGSVTGTAYIFKKSLEKGKSEQQHMRSNGFFIRVRGRVINLEDPMFGIQNLNHAAWPNFALDITAEGLRDHLLSSREGVRDSRDIQEFRRYLLTMFNQCRNIYNDWSRKNDHSLDIGALLSDNPSIYVTEPLFHSVHRTLLEQVESFYIEIPDNTNTRWLSKYKTQISKKIFNTIKYEDRGRDSPVVCYNPKIDNLTVNDGHPFIDKINSGKKNHPLTKLFAVSEILLEAQLQDLGVHQTTIVNLLEDRNRVLRLIAGDLPSTISQILYQLEIAPTDRRAMEVAVGLAFQALGFEYQRKGEHRPGEDGVLYARLGHHEEDKSADYTLVYDAKQTTSKTAIPADKVDPASLEGFRKKAKATYGFFAAVKYSGEVTRNSKINSKMKLFPCLTLLKIEHLNSLLRMHYQYGLTLTMLRKLFEKGRTTASVSNWIKSTERSLKTTEIPIRTLLNAVEETKTDNSNMPPNMHVIRYKFEPLQKFSIRHLLDRLSAVERIIGSEWMRVPQRGEDYHGSVIMYSSAEQIMTKLNQNLDDLEQSIYTILDNPTEAP